MTAPTVAAAIMRNEKAIVAAFRAANATGAERAIAVHPTAPLEVVAWRKLVARAIVRPAAPDRYYLHEASWERFVKLRKTTMLLVLSAVFLFTLGMLLRQR